MVPPAVRQSPEQLIISLVSQLPWEKQQVFDALSHHARPEAIGDAIPLAKFETNSMNAGDSVGIFPTIARINHACSSVFNAAYSWRTDTEEIGKSLLYSGVSLFLTSTSCILVQRYTQRGRNSHCVYRHKETTQRETSVPQRILQFRLYMRSLLSTSRAVKRVGRTTRQNGFITRAPRDMGSKIY